MVDVKTQGNDKYKTRGKIAGNNFTPLTQSI